MAEVKWIKIVTDVFDDEKILMIETISTTGSLQSTRWVKERSIPGNVLILQYGCTMQP